MPLESHTEDLRSTESASIGNQMFAGADSSGAYVEVIPSDAAGPARRFRYRVVKRALDVFLVILCSPLILILFGIIAAAIRIDSQGPVFFSHRRIRRSGEFFFVF